MEEEKIVSPFEVKQENIANVETVEQSTEPSENVQAPQHLAESIIAPVEYAGFWVRFAAFFVDGLVLIIPSMMIQAAFGKNLGGFLGYVLMWTYAIYMLNTRQATFGKMAVGIKVISIDGSNASVGKLALREILGKILNAITLGVGYIMIAFTEKKQGLHDMMADTVVVYDPSRKRRPWLVAIGVIAACVVPVGIILSILLVSLSSARQKAMDAKIKAEQKAYEIQTQQQK